MEMSLEGRKEDKLFVTAVLLRKCGLPVSGLL
jgi:hypothetical protein